MSAVGDMELLLESIFMDETGDYVARGRAHEALSDDALADLCIYELRLLVEQYSAKNNWCGISDVMAELRLRRADMPDGATKFIDHLVALQRAAFNSNRGEH
jgi:hypothetical protein